MATAKMGHARMLGRMLPNTTALSARKLLRGIVFCKDINILLVRIKLISNAKIPKRTKPHHGSIEK